MPTITDVFGKKVRLTDERWNYIISKRPIMKGLKTEFKGALLEPEVVKSSIYDAEVLLYYRYFKEVLDGKYVVAVIKVNHDNFVVTGYVTDRIKKGDVIWKKD